MAFRIMDFTKSVGWTAATGSVLSVTVALASLTLPAALLSGCDSGTSTDNSASQDTETLKMNVSRIDQLTRLGDKSADGQYLVALVTMQNVGKKTLTMTGPDFVLENITDKETERYSQPSETFVTNNFAATYGQSLRDKVVDGAMTSINLYPQLQAERYFVFMVPANAKPDQYQITYTPLKVSAPLASKTTTINDHRNDNAIPPQQ